MHKSDIIPAKHDREDIAKFMAAVAETLQYFSKIKIS
jgi:hypothetical protein